MYMYCCPLSHTCKCTPVRYCWLLSHTAARLSCTTARGHILPITYWLIVTYYYCISSVSPFRLTDFQRKYSLYDAKRKTLDSVSKLFGIACKPFPELSKTGEVRVGECAFAAMICGASQNLHTYRGAISFVVWCHVLIHITHIDLATVYHRHLQCCTCTGYTYSLNVQILYFAELIYIAKLNPCFRSWSYLDCCMDSFKNSCASTSAFGTRCGRKSTWSPRPKR